MRDVDEKSNFCLVPWLINWFVEFVQLILFFKVQWNLL